MVLFTNSCATKLKCVGSWIHVSHLKKTLESNWTFRPTSELKLARKWSRRYMMLIKISKIWEQANLHRHTAPTSLLILSIIDLYYYIDKLTQFNYNHLTFFIKKSHWAGWWFQNVVGPKSGKDIYIKKHELYFRNSVDWILAWKFRWFLDLLRISKVLFIDETEMKVVINLCNTKNGA